MTICIVCFYAEYRFAEGRDYLNVMLSVIILNGIMLSVVMMNVVAPERLVKEVIIKALCLLIVLYKVT